MRCGVSLTLAAFCALTALGACGVENEAAIDAPAFGHHASGLPGMPLAVDNGVEYQEQGHEIYVFPARPVAGEVVTVVVGKSEAGFPFAANSTLVMTADGWATKEEVVSVGCLADSAAQCLVDRGSFHYPKYLVFTLGTFAEGVNVEFCVRNGDSGVWLNNQGHNYRVAVEGAGTVGWVGDVRAFVGGVALAPVDGSPVVDADLTIMAQTYPIQGGVRVLLRYTRDAEPPAELELLWDRDGVGTFGNNTDWYAVLPASFFVNVERLTFSIVASTQVSREVADNGGAGYTLKRSPATPVTLVGDREFSYYGTDFSASYPYRVLYGFSSSDAVEFARAGDRSLLPWFTDAACTAPGNVTADITYTGQNYTLYSNAVTVPAYGKGVLYKLSYLCRSTTSGTLTETPCGESELRYRALALPWVPGWAGNFDWVTFHRPPDMHWGDLNPASMCLCAPGGELGYYLRAEVWVPGVTDQTYPTGGEADVARTAIRADAYSDLASLTPGGALSYTPLIFMGKVGNNFLYSWDVDSVIYAVNAQQPAPGTYRYKLRFAVGANEYWLGTQSGGSGGDYRQITVTR